MVGSLEWAEANTGPTGLHARRVTMGGMEITRSDWPVLACHTRMVLSRLAVATWVRPVKQMSMTVS